MATATPVAQQRVVVPNKHGEKLVGVLHSAGSKEVVVLCHGFRATKEDNTIVKLICALTTNGISAFHFDFSGNGESEGVFQYGNYRKEAEDLRAVILCLSATHEIGAILGHSKGGNVVVLYASMYHDVRTVINVSGRFALDRGIKGRLGEKFMLRIKRDGYVDVMDKTGKVEFRVTEESLMDRLSTNMHEACLSIENGCRVLTVHGSSDEIIPVEDAFEFAKLIPNHKLHIVEGANHCYTEHQEELASVVLDFIKSNQVPLSCPRDTGTVFSRM
ncbi:uncharacterized protein M6B38_133690 [Iris pallida]|uniref:Serine aminopeptidase S33 domain-containing protein n=1 Tax=Iris pallida TaxID=29817 RepID=A0AAX6FI22_IRIPA|nr:uncharacterized protein M6B38_108665 [Iris pallida]KAJ6814594.1 uncharacterized protein M6B38_137290 [Iris pallida]KAJ6815645.1 uncharacterized protein M6B38_133690 [Iris pallida]